MYFVILLVLIGISLSHSNLPDAEARTVAPLSIFLEDATIKQNSFITADGGVPDITIQKGETVSFPLKVSSRGLEPLPVNFFHSIELAIPDTHQATLPDMKIELDPFHMVLKPDKPQIMNVTITTLNYTQLGEHKVTVTAQYPQGEPLLNTRFDVLVIDENQFVKSNDDFKYPVPGGGIIAHLYSLKTQIESGLSYDELRCNEGHVLIQKYDGSPACVKPETEWKLIERGWTTMDFSKEKIRVEEIIGAKILDMSFDDENKSIIVQMNSFSDGHIIITIPRNILDAKIQGEDDDFFILVDGKEVNFEETKNNTERTFTIPFESDSKEIEITIPILI